MKETTTKDVMVGVLGYLGGFILQVIIMVKFHKDPFDSMILLLLPGVPALLMSYYCPKGVWRWLLISAATLPLAGIIAMGYTMSQAEMGSFAIKLMSIMYLEGFIMSIFGVLIGLGLRKLIQTRKIY